MLGIPESALYKYRCHYVVENIGKHVLQQVIQWMDDTQGMTVKERLKQTPGFTETKYKREFNVEQRTKLERNEPLSGYDITLCYKLVQRICGFRSLNDDTWILVDDGSVPSLEYRIQCVKKIRNTLAHEEKIFTEVETRQTIESLRLNFIHILSEVGARATVDKSIVDNKVSEVDAHIQNVFGKIREPLDPTDTQHFYRLQEEARSFQIQLKDELLKYVYEEIGELFQKLYKIEPAPWALHQRYEATPTQVFVRVKVREDQELSSCKGAGHTREAPCDDILDIRNHASKLPDVIILSGEGGKGKTSLIKYFLEQYLKGPECAVKNLAETELLIHVEARNDQIKCFKDLLKSTIPSTYAKMSLSYEHLSDILLGVNKLFLIDGFDEHNPTSRKLVKELLNLPGKNRYIITTRPTSVEDVNMVLPDSKSKLNLQLQGIPEDQHENFVLKLLTSLMVDVDKILEYTRELMKCVRRLKQTLGEQLNTPLNLALIVLLYVVSPETVSNLTSSSDLYRELRSMMTEKLVFRLVTCTDLTESAAKKKCKRFLHFFDQVSFRTFCRKEYELRDNTTEKFISVCEELDIPDDLVLSSYLNTKRSLRGIGTVKVFTYQHLMMQEFAAGCHLARKVIQYVEDAEFPEDIIKCRKQQYSSFDDENESYEFFRVSVSSNDGSSKMPLFSGLSSEKATKTVDSVFQPRRRKLSVSNNILWKVIQMEYPRVECWDAHQREEFITRSQNMFMFMTGAIRAVCGEHLVSIANDIVQLVDDEETTNAQPYADILMRLVAESGNNDEITKVVAAEVDKLTKEKYCIVKENSLSVFQHILKFTCPEMIAFDINANPHTVFELADLLQTISNRNAKLSMVFRYMYHDGNPGDCAPFLTPLMTSTTCELAEFWGSLSNEGLDMLPESLGVMCLRLPPEQLEYLNKSLTRLNLWSLATVVNLSHRPDPSSITPLVFDGIRLVLVIAAVLKDRAEDIEYALDALENLCPEDRNKQVTIIGFWETNLTHDGAVMLLHGLHKRNFVAFDFVVIRTTEVIHQSHQDALTELAISLGQKKLLIIKDP
ncbi:P-loop containing nucleoside triphosphate hydrolase [Trinorchestia longiramus]|nr:P-loop containing nucleoside triphosphate hydrolase [Trinorchestia longiramus]